MSKFSVRIFHLATAALVLALVNVQASQAAALDPPLQLTLDDRFPGLGVPMSFTITGPPDVEFSLKASDTPTEIELPNWGTVFIDTANLLHIGSGVLDGNGEATVVVNVPNNPNVLDRLFHFQARGELGVDRGVSNSVTSRMQTDPPSGTRQPAAIAVTPDGAKAYVAHERDGTITVIDAINDVVLTEIPVATVPTTIGKAMAMEVDPEGRHVYLVDPRRREIVVLHVETDSVAGSIAVPEGTNDIAFDFSGPEKMIYVTNTRDRALLSWEEVPDGTFIQTGKIPVEGHGPGPVIALPDGTLVVGNRHSLDVEFIDPSVPVTLARTALGSLPFDLVARDNDLLVATFTPEPLPDNGDGTNEVLVIDLLTFQLDPTAHWNDLGTDYMDIEASSGLIAVATAGSGSVLLADRDSLIFSDLVEVAPGEPTAHNPKLAFVPDSGSGERLYTINHFRESIRAIELGSGPPFPLGPEIALAYSGQPRVPLVDLTSIDDGDWLFSTVEFFNGTPTNPNPVTCNTCHTWFFSAGFVNVEGKQAQPLFDLGNTGPWLYSGQLSDLNTKTKVLFNNHGAVGGVLSQVNEILMTDFQESGVGFTSSPFLGADGSMSPDALAGQALFEGVANCSTCHVAPLFIPVDEIDRTIELGVGTEMAPINVTTLLGLWATAPYLHDGRAESLMDVLVPNTNDSHGITSILTPTELDQLVAYLQSL